MRVPAGAPCVDVDELKAYMSGVRFSPSQEEAAEAALAGTQRTLELYINRPLSVLTVTERVRGDEAGYGWPTVTPVLEVVSVNAVPVPVGYFYDPSLGVYLGYGSAVLVYRGGYDGASDPDVKQAILQVAAREVGSNHDDTLSVKDLTVRNEGEQARRVPTVGWQKDELQRFDRLRRRTVR